MSEIERLVREVQKHTDHVDVLFANAGATWGEGFDTHPEAAFAKVMDLNVKSVFFTVQKVRTYVFFSPRPAPPNVSSFKSSLHYLRAEKCRQLMTHLIDRVTAVRSSPTKACDARITFKSHRHRLNRWLIRRS